MINPVIPSNDIHCVLYNAHEKGMPILCVGGSEGGLPTWWAEVVAKHVSHPVCALGYFACLGRPDHLVCIELSYFKNVIRWLTKMYGTTQVILIGCSRGGELAMLLGSLFPELFSKIIGLVPSAVVHGGMPFCNQSPWLLEGVPIPFIKGVNEGDTLTDHEEITTNMINKIIPYHANTKEDPVITVENYTAQQARYQDFESETIKVEHINCPLLIFSGGRDAVWASDLYARAIISRLDRHNSTIQREHINYPEAGHNVLVTYDLPLWHPIKQVWGILGGDPAANKAANKECLEKIVNFIEKNELLCLF